MRRRAVMFALVICLAASSALAQVVGWRGDGSGRYPDANPPVKWSRISKAMAGLSCQAAKPGGAKAEHSLADGIVREWLVLGPFDSKGLTKKNGLDKAFIQNEAAVSPAEGDKAGGLSWKRVAASQSLVEVDKLVGDSRWKAVYLYANVHSAADCTVYTKIASSGWNKESLLRVWLNGKAIPYSQAKCALKKGWNRLLVKVVSVSDKRKSVFGLTFYADRPGPDGYITEGIRWQKRLPWTPKAQNRHSWWSSVAQPVIVGNRLYTTVDPQSLVCFDKMTGKMLWIRSDNFTDVAPDAPPEARALDKRIGEIDALVPGREPTLAELDEKNVAEKKIFSLMAKLDRRRYDKPNQSESGISGPTPVTDGKNIYMWYTTGITVCYDLDGNRKWIHHSPVEHRHHGYGSSPCLSGDSLITYGHQANKQRALTAFDKATGKVLWRKTGFGNSNPISSLIAASLGGRDVIVMAQGTLVDAATGNILHDPGLPGQDKVSPVVFGNGKVALGWHLCNQWMKSPFRIVDYSGASPKALGVRAVEFPYDKYPKQLNDSLSFVASPLYHEGLLYYVRSDGKLVVVDAAKGAIVYVKEMGTGWWAGGHRGNDVSSPTLGGKYIYLFDAIGGCSIIEPGLTYKEVARNRIEQTQFPGDWRQALESFMSNPVFDGTRMYFKAEDHLYCIEKK